MPLVMQLDGPRVYPGMGSIVEILLPSSGIPSVPPPTYPTPPTPPAKRMAPRGMRGLGAFDPIAYAAASPFLTFVVGVGLGIFMATRKAKR